MGDDQCGVSDSVWMILATWFLKEIVLVLEPFLFSSEASHVEISHCPPRFSLFLHFQCRTLSLLGF